MDRNQRQRLASSQLHEPLRTAALDGRIQVAKGHEGYRQPSRAVATDGSRGVENTVENRFNGLDVLAHQKIPSKHGEHRLFRKVERSEIDTTTDVAGNSDEVARARDFTLEELA